MNEVSARLGIDMSAPKPSLLHHTEGARKDPPKIFFPRPPKGQGNV